MKGQYTSHKVALEHLKHLYFGRELSYREMAEFLMAYSHTPIHKSHVWYAHKRAKKCPRAIRRGLQRMGLMAGKRKRYRFFFEVEVDEYETIKSWLDWQGLTFSQYMKERGKRPWHAT